MNKNVFVLTGDYWHSSESIKPLIDRLFPEDAWDVIFTEDPGRFMEDGNTPDLFVSFKDPIENDQIPTPVWCKDEFTDILFKRIENGMGFICAHAALTDMPSDHRIVSQLVESVFISHPEQCTVKFVPAGDHEILKDIALFEFPVPDEHYAMKMLSGAKSEILGFMDSSNGRQPALWVNEYGKGKVCMLTPGHNTENLISDEFVKLMNNVVKWCTK